MEQTACQRLIGLAQHGDDRAFEALIEPLLEPSFRLACCMLLDRAAAEDAVQEATLKAWRALGRVHPEASSLRPWFLAIVANQCRSMRRGQWWSVLRGMTSEHSSGDGAESLVPTQMDLASALRRLDPRSRAAVVLRYYLDHSFEEVARVLGGSPGAAKSRIHRALRVMRVRLEAQELEDARA
jgi:RNA polymerase sigma-70 factor, ECF subfamily